MNSTKKIRAIFNLSQQQLGIFLGLSRSRISMAEGGRRELSTHALLQLGRLEKSLQNNIEYPLPFSKIQSGKELAALKAHAKFCTRKAAKAKEKLAILQHDHQRCILVMLALGYLLQHLPEGKAGDKEKLWLELLYTKTMQQLTVCGPAAQVIISLKIQTLEAEATQALSLKF